MLKKSGISKGILIPKTGIRSILSNKVLDMILIMTIHVYMSWPKYVPAVAARRRRLVLFIFNRFKGYLDGIISLK